ncbi:hypothetical protein R1sor_007405 [Riccia sorocarpa]|uniref:TANGO6 HEAT repeat domain-containing protein n=1 Tax=Riccia sorocarpa TaxID=122646 RepID=A0ABD3HWP6_9MARC
MMPSMEGQPPSAKAVLKEARSVLSSFADKDQQDSVKNSTAGTVDSNPSLPSRQFLFRCVELVEEFHRLLKNGTNFEFKDWTVLKAVVELLVRWGIYPYLTQGVGIPLQKRFGQRAASAVANAVSDYVRGSGSLGRENGVESESELRETSQQDHPLVFSADLLSFILLERIFVQPTDVAQENRSKTSNENFSGSSQKEENNNPEAEDDDQKYQGKYTPAVVSSPAALRQHILSHHLIDVLAALLQIAHGDRQILKGTEFWREEAGTRLRTIISRLPVDYVVEAFFSLLGQGSNGTPPPTWMKSEVGKMLSQVVASRSGALATVMERLSGGAESGSVQVYERVAAHLAKVPRNVCTKEDYYKNVCSELRLLLLLPDVSYLDSSSSKAHKNMHHTSIILACLLAHQESSLTEKYFLRPILHPLFIWSKLDSTSEVEEDRNRPEESSLLDSLHIVKLLLTAGHEKSSNLRELLLRLTYPLVPKLMLLEYVLWPSWLKNDAPRSDRSHKGLQTKDEKVEQVKSGLKVGFLEGKRLYNSEEDDEKVKGTVQHLMGCITDIVGCHLTQPVVHSVPILFALLFELRAASLVWPSKEGQIADDIEAGKAQSDSQAMYVSKRLLKGEYWELALALMERLLRRVLSVRKAASLRSSIEKPYQMMAETVNLLETFEVLYSEVGVKAVVKDAIRALPLLKVLLDDSDLLSDEEIVELVLRLLQSAVCQLHEERKVTHEDEHISSHRRAEEVELLNKLEVSLQKIIISSQAGKETKDLAACVRSAISQHMSNLATRT